MVANTLTPPEETVVRSADCSTPEPPASTKDDPRAVRSVFISDIHLGCVYAQTDQLARFLSDLKPDYIYIVGDLIDGWELRRKFNWSPQSSKVLKMLVDLGKQGSQVRYVIGNHDDFLRTDSFMSAIIEIGGFEVANEFVHTTGDNRRFLVIHGDQFDEYEKRSALWSWFACTLYNTILSGNSPWKRLFGGVHGAFSLTVKSWFRSVREHVCRFRRLLAEHARRSGYDGVICGHVHSPEQSRIDGVEYCNTGDWLENCSAILEMADGRLTLAFAESPENAISSGK